MNSLTQPSFLILWDGVAPDELSNDLQQHLSESDLQFSVEKTEEGQRGLPPEAVAVALIAGSAAILVELIKQVGTFLIKRYELKEAAKRSASSKPPQIIIKLDDGEPMEKLDIETFPENIPEKLKSAPVESLKFIGFK